MSTDYDDYYDAAKKDGEPFIQGEHGGCIDNRHPIAKWYDDQRLEAERLVEELRKARERGADRKEIRRLEYALELARNTGD